MIHPLGTTNGGAKSSANPSKSLVDITDNKHFGLLAALEKVTQSLKLLGFVL